MRFSKLRHVELGECERLIVVSDVHLREPSDTNYQLLLKTIDLFQGAGAVVFLGDIFDFFYADSTYFLNRWKSFFDSCQRLRDRGFKTIFVEGNHDFGFSIGRGVSDFFDASGDIEVVARHSVAGQLLLRHGDDVICSEGYRNFRRIIKRPVVQRILALIPHRFLDWACLKWAYTSRNRPERYDVGREWIDECLNALIQSDKTRYNSVNTFVFGHIHVDADFKLTRVANFMSGPDWIACPSFLELDSSGWRRHYLSESRKFSTIRDQEG